MARELADLLLFIIIIAAVGYFACWRLFRPVGKVAEKEINKVRAEVRKDYEELEKEHLGDFEKQTGIYHPDVKINNENTKQLGGK